jgi:glycine/D-amino acid oxidase-like deaminating enzyme/nitrite reductase/ring-hydroxylating ferredoxin subunit
MATTETPVQPALDIDAHTEVCVIGAGIAGMTTAYLLTRAGKSVIVLDDGPIAGGATSRTTAHLSNALDDRYYELERLHGIEGARLAAESHTAAVDRIEQIIKEEEIQCDLERLDGYLFVPAGDPTEQLEREMQAAHRAGLTNVEYVERLPLTCYDFGPALRFPHQGQFHILKYINGLTKAIQRCGGTIFTNTHVSRIEGGALAHIETADGHHIVTAQAVVVATNTPVNDRIAIHTKQAAYRTYVIGARIPQGAIPRMLLWDTADPYYYVRLQTVEKKGGAGESYDLLIVGGEDHKTGQAPDFNECHARLERWTRERFPMVEGIEFRWSGQVMEPVDGLAFIGHNPLDKDNVYIATGDSGNGMTHGTIAGMLLTDLILHRDNLWATIYNPSRKNLGAAAEFVKENLNVAEQYTEHLTLGYVESVDEIAPGEGAVLRRGLKKIAVYRDLQGMLHEHSAVCAHLGCVVEWNDLEKTWDCPCHGSRYAPDGHVINGPAIHGLAPIQGP